MFRHFQEWQFPLFIPNLFLEEKSRKRIFPLIGANRLSFSHIIKDLKKRIKKEWKKIN